MQQQNRLNLKHDDLLNLEWFNILQKCDSHTMLASAWWCTAQIKGNHCGYCCQRNEARLALDQAQHLTCHNCTCNYYFSFEKGWLKIHDLQQLNGQIRSMANRPRSDPGLTRVWPGPDSTYERRSAKLLTTVGNTAAHWSTGIDVWRDTTDSRSKTW